MGARERRRRRRKRKRIEKEARNLARAQLLISEGQKNRLTRGRKAAVLLVGTVGFFVTLDQFLKLTQPTIEPLALGYSGAFSAPFTLTNGSALWPLKNAKFVCIVDYLVTEKSQVMAHMVFVDEIRRDIERGGKYRLHCQYEDEFIFGASRIRSAQIRHCLTYTVFGVWTRDAEYGPFTWYGDKDPPRWEEGESLPRNNPAESDLRDRRACDDSRSNNL